MLKQFLLFFFLLFSVNSFSQTLKGNITDNNKEALSGANILTKGENTGISADKNGDYILNLRPN